MKSKLSRFLITFFFGMFGVHKFIDGKIGVGILYFITIGFFGVGWLYDVLKIFFPYHRPISNIINIKNNKKSSYDINNYDNNPKIVKGHINTTYLLEWQQLLIPGSDQLYLTLEQLQYQTETAIETHKRIMLDCQHLILKTTNVQIFFERYSLLIEKISILQRLKNFTDIDGYQYTEDYDYLLTEYINDKQFYIKQLFDRCWNEAIIKADSMKTEKGKRNQFDKLMSSFVRYKNHMTNDTVQQFLDKYFIRFERYYSGFNTTDDYENLEINSIEDFTTYDIE